MVAISGGLIQNLAPLMVRDLLIPSLNVSVASLYSSVLVPALQKEKQLGEDTWRACF